MFCVIDSPVGHLRLDEENGFITGVNRTDAPLCPCTSPVLCECTQQLYAYFARQRTVFDVPISLHGTPFQQRVWAELQQIPYGQVISYSELARRIGNPGAARAVGHANHCNPVCILVPCHRVIGADGNMTGYGGGLDMKIKLLTLEGVLLSSDYTVNTR